jgi:hypothetical protein
VRTPSCGDLDSLHVRPGSDAAVAAAAAKVGERHDWDASWLNFEVARADALPTLGRCETGALQHWGNA